MKVIQKVIVSRFVLRACSNSSFFSFFLEKCFSPDSLGDGDISRAILLGLNACGVAAVEVVPLAT